MATAYIFQEDGSSKILQEDGTYAIVQEDHAAAVSVVVPVYLLVQYGLLPLFIFWMKKWRHAR